VFREDDYLQASDEPYECVEVSAKGCRWEAWIYERKVGGFDLFYDHENSEFKPLDVAKIAMLRTMSEAENGVVFVAHLGAEKNRRKLIEAAKERLGQWINLTVGG
jgi:hypothetical protein